MKVVILGTGATSGTLSTLGGVASFVTRLDQARSSWRRDYKELANLIADCEGPADRLGLDRLWTRIDYYSKFKLILGSQYGSAAAIQIRKAVADAYSFLEQSAQLCAVTADFTLKRVLAELKAGDALISFNWDTLAETILQHNLGREVVQAPHPSATLHIRLIKPHGSLSWIHSSHAPVLFRKGSRPILEPMTSDQIFEGSGGFAQPLILGAVPIKSELLDEIQRGQAGLHETIADQWREAVDALSRATVIDVVGYSFPPEDGYGRFLLREAIRRRPPGTELPALRYYALQRDREAFERAFREVFGHDINHEYLGEVEGASTATNDAG